MDKKRIKKALDEAQQRMSITSTYTVEIPNYIMARIREDWTATLAKHHCEFNPIGAIEAIVKTAADKIMQKELTKKYGLKFKRTKL